MFDETCDRAAPRCPASASPSGSARSTAGRRAPDPPPARRRGRRPAMPPRSTGTGRRRAPACANAAMAPGYVGSSTTTVSPGRSQHAAATLIACCAPVVMTTSSALVGRPQRVTWVGDRGAQLADTPRTQTRVRVNRRELTSRQRHPWQSATHRGAPRSTSRSSRRARHFGRRAGGRAPTLLAREADPSTPSPATKVPLPRRRSIRPSATSMSYAATTVPRATTNVAASVRSGGSRDPRARTPRSMQLAIVLDSRRNNGPEPWPSRPARQPIG